MTKKTVTILFITIAVIALGGFGYLKWTHSSETGAYRNDKSEKAAPPNDTDTLSGWLFDKADGSRLVFKDGHAFETNLFELKYIGQIPADNKSPYLIFSGRDCNECDANISIYIHSPSDGKLITDYGQNRYPYPGTEKDYETDSVVSVSRAFYGEVLDNIYGVIWYQNRRLDNGKKDSSVLLAHLENGLLKDTTYEDNGTLAATLALLKKGKCHEIAGRPYTSEP